MISMKRKTPESVSLCVCVVFFYFNKHVSSDDQMCLEARCQYRIIKAGWDPLFPY